MKIGLVSGSRQSDEFDKFCHDHNLQIMIREYPKDEIFPALLNGDVNGIVTSSVMSFPNTKVIARFPLNRILLLLEKGTMICYQS